MFFILIQFCVYDVPKEFKFVGLLGVAYQPHSDTRRNQQHKFWNSVNWWLNETNKFMMSIFNFLIC
jgi:hypothetical protein